MRKKLIILLLLPILVFLMCTQVCAVQNVDVDKSCSITFLLDFDGTPLDGGKLTIYRVGQISDDGNEFVLVDSLPQDGLSLDNLEDPDLAKTLSNLAVEYELTPYTATIDNGKAVFSDLKTGVYAVSQSFGDEIPNYAAINPFLISLPQWQNGAYVYDITAYPKVPLVPSGTEPTQPTMPTESTEPTEPQTPTEPDDTPDIPQTGQLNWPIPLMVVLGLSLFMIGWSLFSSAKRREV